MQANTGKLWAAGYAGVQAWPLGLLQNTSPSITTLRGGGLEMAFQSNMGTLWTFGAAGMFNWQLGMMPGTSPSIVALPGGGYEVAFQSNMGTLWTAGSDGIFNWQLGMMPGTSPSVTGVPGGYEMAFQSNMGDLWTTGSAGMFNWRLGMMPGTSPSVTGVPGGYEMAFQSNMGDLWTTGSAGMFNWRLGMMPHSSPGITGVAGGYEVAFQANTGNLWTIGTAPTSPQGSTGVDISQYQCGNIPAAHYGIAIVQVTGGGIRQAPNGCYSAEAAWAGPNLQDYIYMNGLPSPTPTEAQNGPAGVCGANGACLGYNYGWAWTQHWIAYASGAGPTPHHWWLDVETGSGWTDAATNNGIIRGAVDAVRSHGLPVGIYSNPRQWNQITGGLLIPGVDLWVPGAGNLSGPGYSATEFCGDPAEHFAGGQVKYVQYGYTGSFSGAWSGPVSPYDLDYSC